MNSDDGGPVAAGLRAARRVTEDPRLEGWASDTLTENERSALIRDAESDRALSAALDRLRPLDDSVRRDLVEQALAALAPASPRGSEAAEHSGPSSAGPRPDGASARPHRAQRWASRSVRWGAALTAGVAAILAVWFWPRGFEVLDGPSTTRVLPATETVRITIESRTAARPHLFVVVGGRARPVPLYWQEQDGRWSVDALAYELTGGHFGSVELIVASNAEAAAATRDPAARRFRVRVALPSYVLADAAVVAGKTTRGVNEVVNGGVIRVPPATEVLRVTLRPEVTVNSAADVCMLAGQGARGANVEPVEPVEPECRSTSTSALMVDVPVTRVLGGAESARLVLALAPSGPAVSMAAAQRAVRAISLSAASTVAGAVEGASNVSISDAPGGRWQIVRLVLRREALR